ncbi:ABC transporter permease [Beduinella massiliensis]|uniref:ABC transporter permease n=1 Tax=Beduinella massiliensis TaxID=1852363 RepID=UPI0031F743C9
MNKTVEARAPGLKGAAQRSSPLRTLRRNGSLLALCLPAIVLYFLFNYVPMCGIVMAFEKFKYPTGMFHSQFIGLKNFEYLFKSVELWRIVRNTVGYNLIFMVLGPVINISVALLLFEVQNKRALKTYQTIMTFPNFMSWVIVGYITYAILNPSLGIMGQIFSAFGMERVDVYSSPGYWPFIIVLVNTWKGVGMGSMLYFASLMGIDTSLYEAAIIDGASRWQQTRYISIPHLVPLVCIMTIMAMGGIFSGDFGLFYQIPRDVAVLYETTDVVNTYVYRGLKNANFGASSAIGLIQSVVGLIFVGGTNYIIAKVSPDNAMF